MIPIPPDVASELRTWWLTVLPADVHAYAGSIDATLSGRSVTTIATGGPEVAPGIYRPRVSCDFRATTEGQALNLARPAVGLLRHLEHTQRAGDMTVTSVSIITLPYINPDPRHPSLHRVTVNAELTVRAQYL